MSVVPGRPPEALTRGELLAVAAALLLVVLMFSVQWYGVVGIPGRSRTGVVGAEDGWHGLTLIRWELLATVVLALAAVGVRVRKPSRNQVALIRLALAALAWLAAVLLTYRVLIGLPSPSEVVDQKLGAVVAVIAAFGIAIGASEAIREQRLRGRALKHASSGQNRVASAGGAR